MQEVYIFCASECGRLHHCSIMGLDKELRKMATNARYITVVEISGGDLIAIEVKYHLDSLVTYSNLYTGVNRDRASSDFITTTDRKLQLMKIILQARAFPDPVSYIEGNLDNGYYIF